LVTGRTECLAERRADLPADDAVSDPELPDPFIRVRQCETVGGLGVREVGLIEIETDADRFGPGDPILEVLRRKRVAVHTPATGLSVAGVEVEAMPTRDQGKGFLEITPQFLRGSRFAWVIAGNGQTVSERLAGVFEAADIIALPAVDGN